MMYITQLHFDQSKEQQTVVIQLIYFLKDESPTLTAYAYDNSIHKILFLSITHIRNIVVYISILENTCITPSFNPQMASISATGINKDEQL